MDGRLAAGVDVGATLAKLALRNSEGELRFDSLPSQEIPGLCERLEEFAPQTLGVTGCGAAAFAEAWGRPTQRVIEFEAWGRGSRSFLEAQGAESEEPFLLISLGTGTSVLQIAPGETLRLGGTALGGGTVMGLGRVLADCSNYEELCELATRGVRGRVDLLVGDIYQNEEIPLPGDLTAASFGNLGRSQELGGDRLAPRREDLAAAIMGLVGENVGLICCGLGRMAGIERLVYGGSTVHGNPSLLSILVGVTAATGLKPVILENGRFSGALGALELACEKPGSGAS
jgi:type II pantothenate kinase